MVYYIYKLYIHSTHTIYIGKTTNPKKRYFSHIQSLNNNCHCNSSLQYDFSTAKFRSKNKKPDDLIKLSILEKIETDSNEVAGMIEANYIFYYISNGFKVCNKIGRFYLHYSPELINVHNGSTFTPNTILRDYYINNLSYKTLKNNLKILGRKDIEKIVLDVIDYNKTDIIKRGA